MLDQVPLLMSVLHVFTCHGNVGLPKVWSYSYIGPEQRSGQTKFLLKECFATEKTYCMKAIVCLYTLLTLEIKHIGEELLYPHVSIRGSNIFSENVSPRINVRGVARGVMGVMGAMGPPFSRKSKTLNAGGVYIRGLFLDHHTPQAKYACSKIWSIMRATSVMLA